jgi:hypothetical protein
MRRTQAERRDLLFSAGVTLLFQYLEPVLVHLMEKLTGYWITCSTNHRIDSTLRTKRSLIVVDPLRDLGRRKYRLAIEASAESAGFYLCAVSDGVLVGPQDVLLWSRSSQAKRLHAFTLHKHRRDPSRQKTQSHSQIEPTPQLQKQKTARSPHPIRYHGIRSSFTAQRPGGNRPVSPMDRYFYR